MANNLTGDFEAVLQVRLRQINGILATMHQNRIDKNISPAFPHNGSIRVGAAPLAAQGLADRRFGEWMQQAVGGLQSTSGAAEKARVVLTDKAPPGARSLFEQAWRDFDFGTHATVPAGTVAGRVHFQLSNPTVSLAAGSVSEVTVHAWVRARYYPDVGAAPLPEPIHGEVRALYIAAPTTLPDGSNVLRVDVTTDDSRIEFVPAPGTGLSAVDIQVLAGHIRTVLRRDFRPVDVPLSDDFAFAEFTTLGGGPTEAVVLPLQLSGAPFPAGRMASVANHFLGASEFAIAVSKEYIQQLLDVLVAAIRARVAAFRFTVSFWLVSAATYKASLASIAFAWKPGALEISGQITLTTPGIAPNGFISFTQAVTTVLDVPTQTVSVEPIGDPSVNESWFLSHGSAVGAVRSARDAALPAASRAFTASLAGARDKLAGALAAFDASGSVGYNGLELTPDGIVMRGTIGTRARIDPVVHYVEVDGGSAFDAVLSWIPGGAIDQYDWSWVENTHAIPWHNRTKHVLDDHRFVCPRPAGLTNATSVCLAIHGHRHSPDGLVEPVEAGQTCTNSSHEPLLVVPSWWAHLMLPLWQPDPPDDFIVSDIIAGHINAVGGPRTPGGITTNALVHFVGSTIERPLERLSMALAQTRRDELSLLAILVLPAGSFDQRRGALETALGSTGDRFPAQLLITEDYEKGWSKTFAAPAGPSTHLINARGELAWSHEGALDVSRVARALEEHALIAPPPRRVPMMLGVQPGMPAPDTLFTDDNGDQMMLRRFRGQRVILLFWQSWSSACIRELRRMQQEQKGNARILAINSGEDREVLARVRRAHGLSFRLIHDPAQVISTLYGVQSWPTTVSLNEEGIVDRIQFGIAHQHRGEAPADSHP